MKVRLLLPLFPLLLLGTSLYAQSPCETCLRVVEEELRKCLNNAISADDKVSCEEDRRAGMKICLNGECTIERDEHAKSDERKEQQTSKPPGLTPYIPTKIEWLALAVNSQLRQDSSTDRPFVLSVVQVDYETLLIFIRYHPTVSREMMTSAMNNAREVILSTAKSYGWDNWVKIRERVEMYTPPK